jgi:hypothetical protein
VLVTVELVVPGSDSFDPRLNRTLVTILPLLIPCILILWDITESRRRFWPTNYCHYLGPWRYSERGTMHSGGHDGRRDACSLGRC